MSEWQKLYREAEAAYDSLKSELAQARKESEKWKWEYDNLCKFATQFEERLNDARKELEVEKDESRMFIKQRNQFRRWAKAWKRVAKFLRARSYDYAAGWTQARAENDRYRSTLESISKNRCCDSCREAALWADGALHPVAHYPILPGTLEDFHIKFRADYEANCVANARGNSNEVET
jgi:hypothetical protein